MRLFAESSEFIPNTDPEDVFDLVVNQPQLYWTGNSTWVPAIKSRTLLGGKTRPETGAQQKIEYADGSSSIEEFIEVRKPWRFVVKGVPPSTVTLDGKLANEAIAFWTISELCGENRRGTMISLRYECSINSLFGLTIGLPYNLLLVKLKYQEAIKNALSNIKTLIETHNMPRSEEELARRAAKDPSIPPIRSKHRRKQQQQQHPTTRSATTTTTITAATNSDTDGGKNRKVAPPQPLTGAATTTTTATAATATSDDTTINKKKPALSPIRTTITTTNNNNGGGGKEARSPLTTPPISSALDPSRPLQHPRVRALASGGKY